MTHPHPITTASSLQGQLTLKTSPESTFTTTHRHIISTTIATHQQDHKAAHLCIVICRGVRRAARAAATWRRVILLGRALLIVGGGVWC